MKINIGKWLKRQIFSGKPVNVGTTLDLLAVNLGYDSRDALIAACANGTVTPAFLIAHLSALERELLADELRQIIARLQMALKAL